MYILVSVAFFDLFTKGDGIANSQRFVFLLTYIYADVNVFVG